MEMEKNEWIEIDAEDEKHQKFGGIEGKEKGNKTGYLTSQQKQRAFLKSWEIVLVSE